MAASEGKKAGEDVAAASGAGGGGLAKLVPILTIVNVAVSVAMIAILFISFSKESKKQSVEDIAVHSEEAGGHGDKAAEGKEGGGHGDKAAEGKEGAAKKAVDYGKMVTLDPFTVNLSTPGSVSPKFVRVNISLEVPSADIEAEVVQKMPQIRNVVIDLFNSKRPADLATVEGRDYLKEEIKNSLNSFLVSGKVRGVYFTNFALSS